LQAYCSRKRSHSLDRQEHYAIAKRTARKPMVLIKANGIVINGVSYDYAYTSDL
jgi:hypothetical protein